MLSLQRNFLFIHVPKTGGNSIQNLLSGYSEDKIITKRSYQDGKERFELRGMHPKLTKHSTLKDYRKYLSRRRFDCLFKFSTIRNPWERLVSLYFSPSSGRTEWSREAFIDLIEKTYPLEHYIGLEPSIFSRFFREAPTLDASISYLIRFEALETDFHEVCRQLDLPLLQLPVFNKSSRAHYSAYYDEDLVAMITDKYSREIKWGNYRFEPKPINGDHDSTECCKVDCD